MLGAERKRWITWLPVLLGCGIGLYFSLPYEPSYGQSGAFLTLSVVLAWLVYRHIPRWFLLAAALVVIAIGNALSSLHAHMAMSPAIAKDLGVVWIRGTVDTIEVQTYGNRMILSDLDLWQPERKNFPASEMPKKIRINIRTGMEGIQPGDRVGVKAILMPPPARPVYPGAYDFARWAYFEHIGAVGYSVSDVELRKKAEHQGFSQLRHHITHTIQQALVGEGKDISHMATALLTGQRGGISKGTLEEMRQAGLGHLLAISGLHMTLVMAGCFFIIRALLALVSPLALRFSIKKWSAIVALIAGFIYLMITGTPVSAERAYIMAGLFFLAILLDRTGTPMRPVMWAALGILLVAPESILSPSFQMSFSAVVALVAFFERNRFYQREYLLQSGYVYRVRIYLLGLVCSSLIAGTATAPFAVYHFGRYASYGLLANMVAIPLTSFWIMPWGMLALLLMPLGLEQLALVPMAWGIEQLVTYAGWITSLPKASILLPQMPVWPVIVLALAGLWLCLWSGKIRWYAMPALVLMLPWFMFPARLPDILVREDGKLVAVRDKGGGLVFYSLVAARYTREQWLRYYGQEEAIHARDSEVLVCEETFCRYTLSQSGVLFWQGSTMPKSYCQGGEKIIQLTAADRLCEDGNYIITYNDLEKGGAHVIWLDNPPRIETVQEKRGKRLWTVAR